MGKSSSKEFSLGRASKRDSESKPWGFGFPRLSFRNKSTRRSDSEKKAKLRNFRDEREDNRSLGVGSQGRKSKLSKNSIEKTHSLDEGSQGRNSKLSKDKIGKGQGWNVGSQGRKSKLPKNTVEKTQSLDEGSQGRSSILSNETIEKYQGLDVGSQGRKSKLSKDKIEEALSNGVGSQRRTSKSLEDVARKSRSLDTGSQDREPKLMNRDVSKSRSLESGSQSRLSNYSKDSRSNQNGISSRGAGSSSKSDDEVVIAASRSRRLDQASRSAYHSNQSLNEKPKRNYQTHSDQEDQVSRPYRERPESQEMVHANSTHKQNYHTAIMRKTHDSVAVSRKLNHADNQPPPAALSQERHKHMTIPAADEISVANQDESKRDVIVTAKTFDVLVSYDSSSGRPKSKSRRRSSRKESRSLENIRAKEEREISFFNHSLSKEYPAVEITPIGTPGPLSWEPTTVLTSKVQKFTNAHPRSSLRGPRKSSANPETRKAKSLDRVTNSDYLPYHVTLSQPTPNGTVLSEARSAKHLTSESAGKEKERLPVAKVLRAVTTEWSEQSPSSPSSVGSDVVESDAAVSPTRPTTLSVTPYSDGASARNERKLVKVNLPSVGGVLVRKDGLLRQAEKRTSLLSNADSVLELVSQSSSLPRSPSVKALEQMAPEISLDAGGDSPRLAENKSVEESAESVFTLLPAENFTEADEKTDEIPDASPHPVNTSQLPPVRRSNKPQIQRPPDMIDEISPPPLFPQNERGNPGEYPKEAASKNYSYYPPIRFTDAPEEASYFHGDFLMAAPKSKSLSYSAYHQVSLLPEAAVPPDSAKPRSVTLSAVSVTLANARHKRLTQLNVEAPDVEDNSVNSYVTSRKIKHVSFQNVLENFDETAISASIVEDVPVQGSDLAVPHGILTSKSLNGDLDSISKGTELIEAGTVRQRILALRKTLE